MSLLGSEENRGKNAKNRGKQLKKWQKSRHQISQSLVTKTSFRPMMYVTASPGCYFTMVPLRWQCYCSSVWSQV